MCGNCRGGNTNPRACRGWFFSFRGLNALRFEPSEVKGRAVRVAIEGLYDFRHSMHGRSWTDWTKSPIKQTSSVLVVEDVRNDRLLTRQHLDLAEPAQAGPVWHLQLGGLPSEGQRPEHEWLDEPRWPSRPLDFTLTVELAVYGFFWEAWNQLKVTNPWKLWVHRSEELILSHYHERITDYWNRRTDLDSWLAAQCNRSSDWDPRPS